MARKVLLALSAELQPTWANGLKTVKCESGSTRNLAECTLLVLEISKANQDSVESRLLVERPVIVVTDFSARATTYLEQIRPRIVGLCSREQGKNLHIVTEYLETGLILARTLSSFHDQKVIWAAKGTLMDHYHLSEADAHRRMQTASMKTGRALRDIAQAILTAEEVSRDK